MKKRILVIEDDAALARVLRDNLEFDGFETLCVVSGAAALNAVKTFTPDLVLLDLMLPDANGFELFAPLRQGGCTPIIILTARGQKADKISIVNFSVQGTIEERILDRLYMRVGIFERSLGDLEPIIGSEIQELTLDLLSRDLTADQEQARIEQTQRAIEAKRQAERELEESSSAFMGTSDFILQRISEARQRGR